MKQLHHSWVYAQGGSVSPLQRHLHTSVYRDTMHNSQGWNQLNLSISRLMGKENIVYMCTMRLYSVVKNNKIMSFA